MKNKKGFTLIELLAIIIILAIIAVITTPIILNTIENSKKGAATDSAYGFKDAVSKAYLTNLSEDSDYEITDNKYTVEQLKTQIGLSISGKEPASNSWVIIQENEVTEGCLQFDEYKVEITGGEVSNSKKGECTEPKPTMAEMCPGCVFGKCYEINEIGKEVPSGCYSSDYTNSGNVFFGQIVNETIITNSFVCGKEGDYYFCLEGYDTSKYENNKKILDSFFSNCSENVYNYGTFYSCTGTNLVDVYAGTDGNVHLYKEGELNWNVYEDGKSYVP